MLPTAAARVPASASKRRQPSSARLSCRRETPLLLLPVDICCWSYRVIGRSVHVWGVFVRAVVNLTWSMRNPSLGKIGEGGGLLALDELCRTPSNGRRLPIHACKLVCPGTPPAN